MDLHVNLSLGIVINIATGENLEITNLFDEDGDECQPEEAISAVAGPDRNGQWLAINLLEFVPARIEAMREGQGTTAGPQVLGSVTDDGAKDFAASMSELGDVAIGVVNGLLYDRVVMKAALVKAEAALIGPSDEFEGCAEALAAVRAALYKPN